MEGEEERWGEMLGVGYVRKGEGKGDIHRLRRRGRARPPLARRRYGHSGH